MNEDDDGDDDGDPILILNYTSLYTTENGTIPNVSGGQVDVIMGSDINHSGMEITTAITTFPNILLLLSTRNKGSVATIELSSFLNRILYIENKFQNQMNGNKVNNRFIQIPLMSLFYHQMVFKLWNMLLPWVHT